jgi:hypothetical protein
MKNHFNLDSFLNDFENYKKSLKSVFLTYNHFFPKITFEDFVEEAENERNKFIKFLDEGIIEIIENDEKFLKDYLEK